MQFTTSLLAIISASGALALPQRVSQTADNTVVVTLAGDSELATNTFFTRVQFGQREKLPPVASSGPFKTVNLRLGADVPKQDLRCQILDLNEQPITVKRGANIDTTFADGGNGEWTFLEPAESEVSFIICDPTFVKASQPVDAPQPPAGGDASGVTVRAILSGPSELQTQTEFFQGGAVREVQPPIGSAGPYDTFELMVDGGAEDLRCQLISEDGKIIIAQRGENIDTTFSDAGNGPWSFLNPAESNVEKIICDPAFKANPLQ